MKTSLVTVGFAKSLVTKVFRTSKGVSICFGAIDSIALKAASCTGIPLTKDLPFEEKVCLWNDSSILEIKRSDLALPALFDQL